MYVIIYCIYLSIIIGVGGGGWGRAVCWHMVVIEGIVNLHAIPRNV